MGRASISPISPRPRRGNSIAIGGTPGLLPGGGGGVAPPPARARRSSIFQSDLLNPSGAAASRKSRAVLQRTTTTVPGIPMGVSILEYEDWKHLFRLMVMCKRTE
ncbi:unnamed protein product, partial [Amoebophrya sp. A120]|eukprot:GSA120T00001780001.1